MMALSIMSKAFELPFFFRRNLSAFEYDDFPALTGKPHNSTSKKSPGNH